MKCADILATQPFPNHFYILSLLLRSKVKLVNNLVCTLAITIVRLDDKGLRKHIEVYFFFIVPRRVEFDQSVSQNYTN